MEYTYRNLPFERLLFSGAVQRNHVGGVNMFLAVAERLHLTQIQIGAEIGGVVIAGAQTSRQRRLDYGVGVITVRHWRRMLIITKG